MRFNIDSSRLENDLLAETLNALAVCYKQAGMKLYVVGATARDIALQLTNSGAVRRKTLDLDVAVLLDDWTQYENLTGILLQNNFVKLEPKQKFMFKGREGQNNYEVDIVPFGAIAEDGMVAWPPEGSPVMSVKCFDEVMSQADVVVVDDEYEFRIASLAGQFVIKLDAWSDRHLMTRKDASDMLYILENVYIAYALTHSSLSEAIDINAETFDTLVAGAEWIGDELRNILSANNRSYYAEILMHQVQLDVESPLINNMLDASFTDNFRTIKLALKRIAELLTD